jgi:hypothetical protein
MSTHPGFTYLLTASDLFNFYYPARGTLLVVTTKLLLLTIDQWDRLLNTMKVLVLLLPAKCEPGFVHRPTFRQASLHFTTS